MAPGHMPRAQAARLPLLQLVPCWKLCCHPHHPKWREQKSRPGMERGGAEGWGKSWQDGEVNAC